MLDSRIDFIYKKSFYKRVRKNGSISRKKIEQIETNRKTKKNMEKIETQKVRKNWKIIKK